MLFLYSLLAALSACAQLIFDSFPGLLGNLNTLHLCDWIHFEHVN